MTKINFQFSIRNSQFSISPAGGIWQILLSDGGTIQSWEMFPKKLAKHTKGNCKLCTLCITVKRRKNYGCFFGENAL